MRKERLLQNYFKDTFSFMHKKRQNVLFGAVGSLMEGASLSLTSLGRNFKGIAKERHQIRKMDPLLGNKHLHREIPTIYKAINKLTMTSPLSFICVDWSCLSYLLRASMKIHGRSLVCYLIKYSSVAINRHQIKINDHSSKMLSPICIAYKLKRLECFIELLKHKANVFSIYSNGLPLAHKLFNLPISNAYRQALIEHTDFFRNKTIQFFATLALSVHNKLLSDPTITPLKRSSLIQSLELYQTYGQRGSMAASSRSSNQQATRIALSFNQDALEELRHSPDFRDKIHVITNLSRTFSQILKKQRQESTFKAQSNLFYTNLNRQIDDNELLRDQLKNCGKEAILQAMDENISQLQDYIFIWNNQGKVLPKKKMKLLNDAIERVNKPQTPPSPICDQSSLNAPHSYNRTDLFHSLIKEVFEDILISQLARDVMSQVKHDLEFDELAGLDFMAATEQEKYVSPLASSHVKSRIIALSGDAAFDILNSQRKYT